eukprot:12039126-Alexandrium_andersonii.AAC.1
MQLQGGDRPGRLRQQAAAGRHPRQHRASSNRCASPRTGQAPQGLWRCAHVVDTVRFRPLCGQWGPDQRAGTACAPGMNRLGNTGYGYMSGLGCSHSH